MDARKRKKMRAKASMTFRSGKSFGVHCSGGGSVKFLRSKGQNHTDSHHFDPAQCIAVLTSAQRRPLVRQAHHIALAAKGNDGESMPLFISSSSLFSFLSLNYISCGDECSFFEPARTAGVSEFLFEHGGELMRTEKGTFVEAACSSNTPRCRAYRLRLSIDFKLHPG